LLFVSEHVVLVLGNKTHRAECGCNEAAGYKGEDIENCQFVGKCLMSSYNTYKI